ncbi:ATPase-AAA-core domain-containing protein [Mycena venus]|uniref:ATPase-AAA-core domain-containing protein n=1 Tax=Mycena venus TaxID=2733690 RepID=A0A8H7D8J2_9AGAR|nr:ATPase-AAA-core domain-containing protein [Mycena venus]
MPLQTSVTEIRLNNVLSCLKMAVGLLNVLNDSFGTPFLPAIERTTLALINEVQSVKRNKVECIQLLESVHGLLYTIVDIHIKSGTMEILPPIILNHIGRFTETIHKIHTFVEAQRDGNKIKNFFRQSEMTTLLRDCWKGLQQGMEVFEIETSVRHFNSISEMQKKSQNMHNKLLELIANFSDWETSDGSSSMYNTFNSSSRSFSMLPSRPKIFYGREEELENILQNLAQDSPRITILGPGGMGKTSLARAILHHPNVITKYEHRFFVPCDSATTRIEAAALIGSHLGLEPGKDLTKSVIRHFSEGPPCLLILDNLETAWEPIESRDGIEEFLSLLTDVLHLALVWTVYQQITMRGTERPSKVRWTRPFLAPLKSLSDDAAHQVFISITDDVHDTRDVDRLLRLTDNMPLAIDLIAHMVDDESCSSILARWKTEKTALFSAGHDKGSNLDASIAISLSSPRVKSLAGSRELLSLMSILPDGLSDVELLQSNLPIQNIQGCKTALLRTSLAYMDDKKRLKSLVPIREHVQQYYPPDTTLIQPLRKHFQILLELYRGYHGGKMEQVIGEIHSNKGNLQQLLMLGLHADNSNLADTINCTLSLNSFSRMTGHGNLSLMDEIPAVLPRPINHRLEIAFITEVFNSRIVRPISTPELLISEGLSHLKNIDHPRLESDFYVSVGSYYYYHRKDPSTAMNYVHKALALSQSSANASQQSGILNLIATFTHKTGDIFAAQKRAQEAGRLATLCGDLYEEARAQKTEAACCTSRSNFQAALPLLSRAQTLLELCGMSDGNLNLQIKNQEAQVHLLKSEYAEALDHHNQVIKIISEEERPVNYGFSLVNIAEIGVLMGTDEHDVLTTLEKAKTIFNTFHYHAELEYCDMILADLMLRGGNMPAAKIVFEKSIRSSWGKDDEATSYCLDRVGNVSRWSATDLKWAFTWAVIYLGYAQRSRQKLPLHRALHFLGDFFLFKGVDETAQNLLIVALEGFTHMDVHRSRAECMMRLGDLAKKMGDLSKATEFHKTAGLLFERSMRKDGRKASIEEAAGEE